MARSLDIEEKSGEILWADVGERLGLSVSSLRSIRQRFGNVLGLPTTKRVPKEFLPTINLIQNLRNMGVEDQSIEQELLKGKDEKGWPDLILKRIEAAKEGRASSSETLASAPDEGVKPDSQESIEGFIIDDEPLRVVKPLEEVSAAQNETASSVTLTMPKDKDGTSIPPHEDTTPYEMPEEEGTFLPEDKVLNMFLDLRREIATHESSQRAELQRLNYVIQKLYQEVRDLRYALILAGGRRSRKEGQKSTLRLLL